MRHYSVHAPSEEPDSPERFLFIKDGFSWPAFFVPILWILWHRLWLALVYYIVFVLLIAWTGRLANEDIAVVVAILWSLLFALEANNIRRLSLESRDWDEVGSSHGQNLAEAEARFFATGPDQPETLDRRAAMTRAFAPEPRPQATDEPILGLFPEPER